MNETNDVNINKNGPVIRMLSNIPHAFLMSFISGMTCEVRAIDFFLSQKVIHRVAEM